MIPRLPALAPHLPVPRTWRVTAIAMLAACPLRAMARYRFMPPSPQAMLGSIAHRAFELAALNRAPSPSAAIERALDEFDASNASSAVTVHLVPFRNVISRAAWDAMVARSLTRLELLISTAAPATAGHGHGAAHPFVVANMKVGAVRPEVPLELPGTGIRGKADLITRTGRTSWEIRDHKNGSATDRLGSVRNEYIEQLQLYGAMLRAAVGEHEVSLVVDDGAEHAVESSTAELDAAEARARAAVAPYASGADVATTDAARVGAACEYCDVRPGCSAYRAVAPSWWRQLPDHAIPMDTWGRLVALRRGRAGDAIELEDDAGRLVRCDSLAPTRGLGSLTVGSRIYVFGVMAIDWRAINGRRAHPRNFYELPRDRDERRGWSTAVFSD